MVASCSTHASKAWFPRAGRSTASVRSWPDPGDGSTGRVCHRAVTSIPEGNGRSSYQLNSRRIFTSVRATGLASERLGPSVWPFKRRCPMPEATDHPDARELTDDEKHLARLGYKQELGRSWSELLQLRHLVLDHLDPGRLLHHVRPGVEQRRTGRDLAGAGRSSPRSSCSSASRSVELVSAYPTSGGIYWWAAKLGGPAAGFFTGWLNLIGLLAVTASVAYGAATFLDLTLSTISEGYADGYSLRRVFLVVHRDPGPRGPRQHLQRAPAGHHQQRVRVVARGRRGDRHPDPDHRPGHPPERRLRLHRADQQLRPPAAASTGSSCCRSASS